MIGVFGDPPRLGRRDGDEVVDLSELGDVFRQPALNALMAQGRIAWEDAIERAQAHDGPRTPLAEATLHLPFEVADYVDFNSSLEHATNVGRVDAQARLRGRARLRRRHVRPRPNGTVISRGSLGDVRGRVQAAV